VRAATNYLQKIRLAQPRTNFTGQTRLGLRRQQSRCR